MRRLRSHREAASLEPEAAQVAMFAASDRHPHIQAPLRMEGEIDLNLSVFLARREEVLEHPLVVTRLHVPPVAIRLTNAALTALLNCATWLMLSKPQRGTVRAAAVLVRPQLAAIRASLATAGRRRSLRLHLKARSCPPPN